MAGPEWARVSPVLGALGLAGARRIGTIGVDAGAYSPAGRWIIETDDGERLFVKAMQPRSLQQPGIEREHAALCAGAATWCPQVRAWDPGGADSPAVLVSQAYDDSWWGVPVTTAHAIALRHALDEVAACEDVPSLPVVAAPDPWPGGGWPALLDDHDCLARRGIGDAQWFEHVAGVFASAAASVDASGSGLVHGDLWRQNWCIDRHGRAVVVDWTGARRGNPRLNHAWGECGVRAAGGPEGSVLSPADPEHGGWAAFMCGLACSFLALDDFDRDVHRSLHATQVREAVAAVDWACDALEQPRPVLRDDVRAVGPWRP